MYLDKAIVTNSRNESFKSSVNSIHYCETSVLINNHDGQPSKIIRIASSMDSQNLEIEYREEEKPNPYTIRG